MRGSPSSWQPVTEDVKITPKKASPKDMVQPVKIEKQENSSSS